MKELYNLTKEQLIEKVVDLEKTISHLNNNDSVTEKNIGIYSKEELDDIDIHFKLLMDQSPSVIEIYAMDGLQIAVNKAYEKLWGFPASTTVGVFNVLKSKEVVETGLIEYVNKAYRGYVTQVPEYKFNPTGQTEAKGVGRERWLSTRIFPIKNTDDQVINIVITHEDVTDVKEAQEKIRESENRYSSLVNTINSGVAIYKVINDGENGDDYIFQEFNKAAEEIENLPKDQVIGKSLKDLRPNIDDYGLISIFRKVWKTGKAEYFPAKEYKDNKYSNYYENRVFKLSKNEIVAIYDDVTEKENAIIEIRSSKERFDIAMNASRDGLYDWDLITNSIYYSPGWKKILGYEDKELKNDFSIWETLTKPEDVKKSWEMLEDLINKKRDRFELEFKMKHKDGHWVDILSRAEAVFNDDEKAIRVIGTHVDISELKQAKEDIRLINSAIENSITAYDIIDKNGKFIYVNKAFLELWGFENKGDIVGLKPEDIVADKSNPKIIQDMVQKHGNYSLEVEAVRNDGIKIDILVSAFIFKNDDGDIYYCTSTVDITDRKRNRKALKKSEERFRGLFESKLVGQFFWNADGEITDANDAFLEIMGYTKEEVLNQVVSWKEMTPLEYAEKDEQLLLELAEKGVISPFEKEYYHKDGHRIPIMLGAATLPGQTTNGVAFVLDISNQKKAEKELQDYKEKLEDTIAERTNELELKNKELDNALKVFVGREKTINELQKRIQLLESEL